MSNHVVMYDAFFIDDADRIICTAYVDLREAADRSPITALIEGCAKQYAIENLKKVRISKPEQFRKRGEGLIKDPSEAQASHTEIVSETIDDPRHLQLLTEAVDGISKRLQVPIEIASLSTRISHKTTDSVIYGKNGWIFSTSIEPTNREEHERWRESLPEEYDHVSSIRRPRGFARELGLMVVEQLGPQGKKQKWTIPSREQTESVLDTRASSFSMAPSYTSKTHTRRLPMRPQSQRQCYGPSS